jgi:hypothetical protein
LFSLVKDGHQNFRLPRWHKGRRELGGRCERFFNLLLRCARGWLCVSGRL